MVFSILFKKSNKFATKFFSFLIISDFFSFPWLKQYKNDKVIDDLLRRWDAQVKKGGTRLDKLKQIFDHTKNRFADAKRNFHIVHDFDIRRWASQKNAEVRLEGFKASISWVQRFKAKEGYFIGVILCEESFYFFYSSFLV